MGRSLGGLRNKSQWLSIAGTGQKKGGAETKEVKKVNGDSKEVAARTK